MSASRGSRLTFRHHFHYQRRDANGGIRAIRTQRPGPMAVERLAAPVLLGGTVRRERPAARFSASVGSDFGSDSRRSSRHRRGKPGPWSAALGLTPSAEQCAARPRLGRRGPRRRCKGCPVLGVEPRIRRGVLDQGLQPRLLPGGDGCGTGHLIHESQGEQRPQSAAHRCRLWQRAPACKASWVGAWRRSTRPDPSTSSGESGRAAVQRHCDVGHNRTPRRVCSLPLMTVIGWSDASAAGAAA